MAEELLKEKYDVLVIGSGAAGLASALRLHALGVTDLAVVTEGLKMGTSINTGSDKQTYYKLGIYGREPDSISALASDLFAPGAVHGDIAFAEAATSLPGFFNLVNLGVPFPHDEYGEFIGYKTDHDPKRRATSCGPYTSRDMCRALTEEIRRKNIPVFEHRVAVSLLKSANRCTGAVIVDTDSPEVKFSTVFAENIVFACGGPGGLYSQSVYPKVHTGAIGLALKIGAKARNLPECQYGLASVKFRWNVSGSYMQVLPRFVSVDEKGREKEFLREYFPTPEAMYDMIFLKGYQWPFAAGHVPGSSLIDIFVHIETAVRKNRVFLDYRSDPSDLDLSKLSPETREYLERSGALGQSPLERLEKLNHPAIELYREHGIRLEKEMLEVAVCAQHNNGGLAGDLWWESENIEHLFPVGEVNGSHGITRPGGSALNAGQCGAFRASEFIAKTKEMRKKLDLETAKKDAEKTLETLCRRAGLPAVSDWKQERSIFQNRMSESGAFLRDPAALEKALSEAQEQYARLQKEGFAGEKTRDAAEILRNDQLLFSSIVYLSAMRYQAGSGTGSRGGAVELSENGKELAGLPGWKIVPEDPSYRSKTLESTACGNTVTHEWKNVRPLPSPDGWFETVWKEYREKGIYFPK